MASSKGTASRQGSINKLMNYSELKLVPPQTIPKGEFCETNKPEELYKLGLLMEAICENEKGVGLSAVQLGIPLNFFIVKSDDSYRYFLNCVYTPLSEGRQKCVEGCLSIKSRYFEVERFSNILVEGKEIVLNKSFEINDIKITPEELDVIIFQHEIDHQLGVLISDIGKEVFLWEK